VITRGWCATVRGIGMYIVRRMARLSGMGGMPWAIDITKAVQDCGGATSLWSGGPGATFGTVAWSTMVDSFEAYTEFADSLSTNEAYLALAAQGVDHIDTMEPDVMMQVVHGELAGQAPVGTYLGAINATMNPDRAAEAGVFAAQIADAWTATTGVAAVVTTFAAGSMNEIGWLARHENAASVDAANAKIAASASYAEALAAGAGLFSSGNQMYARRVA
jgi:hypothetical protein